MSSHEKFPDLYWPHIREAEKWGRENGLEPRQGESLLDHKRRCVEWMKTLQAERGKALKAIPRAWPTEPEFNGRREELREQAKRLEREEQEAGRNGDGPDGDLPF